MSRLFDGTFSVESVSFAVGNAPVDQGPITIAALVKPATLFTSAHCFIIIGLNGTTAVWALQTDSATPFMIDDFQGGPALTADNWYWLVATKASSDVPPRWHIKNVTGAAAWSHTDASGNVGDGTGPITSVIVGNEAAAGGTDWRGNVAALAAWDSELNDAAVEAACTDSAADLSAASPAWGTLWNQESTATAVADFTGGGGDQTAVSGTSVSSDEPPGWSYELTAGEEITGSAATSVTFAGAASGTRTVAAVAVTGVAFTAAAAGTRTVSASGAGAITFAGVASGIRTLGGTAATTIAVTSVASGRRTVSGAATASISFAATVVQGVRAVAGSASAALVFAAPVVTIRTKGVGPRLVASTRVGRYVQSTPAGRRQ